MPHLRRSHHSEKRSRSRITKTSGKIPQIFGLAHGHAGFGKRNGGGEFAEVGGLPVLSAGLRGEAFEQFAILFGVEVFRYAIHALKGQDIAAEFLCLRALRRDFSQIRAGLRCRPCGLKLAGSIGHRRHLDQSADAARAEDVSFDFRIGRGIVLLVAHIGGDGDRAVIEQHLGGNGRGHMARSIRNHPAQKLLPEEIVRGVAERRTHLPAPTASGGHDRGAAVSEIFRDQQRQFFAFGRDHVGENLRARFGSAGMLTEGLGPDQDEALAEFRDSLREQGEL